MKKFLTIAIITLFVTCAGVAHAVKPVPYKVICHHNSGNTVTLSFVNEQSYNGHLGTPHNDQVFDTDGACAEVTPTIDPSVTPTVDPSVTPTVTPSVTPEVTATPSATPSGDGKSDGLSDGKSSCPECTQPPKAVVPAAAPATGRG